ncbi:MAG: collagen-like protein, partial [bacterium]
SFPPVGPVARRPIRASAQYPSTPWPVGKPVKFGEAAGGVRPLGPPGVRQRHAAGSPGHAGSRSPRGPPPPA